jgi:glutamate-ammonia-ligase adenylyltransferase
MAPGIDEEVALQAKRLFGSADAEQFQRVCLLSEYVKHGLLRHFDIVSELVASRDLTNSYAENELDRNIRQSLSTTNSFDVKLREIRRREMIRIIFRDFSRVADLDETTGDLSDLADTCISVCLEHHFDAACATYGIPKSWDGSAQQMSVLALGKLGARELNLSSDIDLIFLYDAQGVASSESGKETSNQAFFLKVSRQIISSLNNTTQAGFVFRVDMRLRPYGESGALILHRAAMEKYFVEQGRDWERYAFIKARVVAGDIEHGKDFLAWLKPFVYRKHLDYGAIESLRDMKRLINRQVEINDLQQDLKLGPGGIREVEFIAQAHQLIFGGNNPDLRERRLRKVLRTCGQESYLPEDVVHSLELAYVFLRNSEHAIQGWNDKQTQKLPEDEASRSRLAEVMACANWVDYVRVLERHRSLVRDSFATLMSANQAETDNLVEGNLFWLSVWADPGSAKAVKYLESAGFSDAKSVTAQLSDFISRLGELQEIGQERLNKLMPIILSLAAGQKDPDTTVERLLPVIEAVLRRSTYLAFLLENADALKRTVDLCAMSPWIATQLKEMPILLYELSDRNTHEVSFGKAELVSQLDSMMMVLEDHDLEAQMDTLRQFKSGAILRIAAFELLGLLPVMKASDALTRIAELVLQKAFELAWQQLVAKHGLPISREAPFKHGEFAIIAYGKLGGIELAYGSDLDLVFVVDGDIHGSTDGEKQINNNVFFSRMAQRIIHILTLFTSLGSLYEVDMRLRPSGNKGPIITTVGAYERYLESEAWTWEHQALVRARFVAGHASTGERFSEIRSKSLAKVRDNAALMSDVTGMREKMRKHLASDSGNEDSLEQEDSSMLVAGFDLKHDVGAIVDIEFMVQYAVLASAHEFKELTRWTDKIRLLDEMQALHLFQAEEIELLQDAYLAYRSVVHYQWLGGEMASFSQLQEYRQAVVSVWNKYMTNKQI